MPQNSHKPTNPTYSTIGGVKSGLLLLVAGALAMLIAMHFEEQATKGVEKFIGKVRWSNGGVANVCTPVKCVLVRDVIGLENGETVQVTGTASTGGYFNGVIKRV